MPGSRGIEIFGGASVPYVPQTAYFDGAQRMTAPTLAGDVDGRRFTFCASFKLNGGNGTTRTLFHQNVNQVYLQVNSANLLQLIHRNTSNATTVNLRSTTSFLDDTDLHTVLISYDSDVAGSARMIVDGSDVTNETTFNTGSDLSFNNTNFRVGSNNAFASTFLGCLGNIGVYQDFIDFSVQANIDRFVSGNVMLDPGADGSNYFGSQPIIMLQDGPATFNSNSGYGGDFGAPEPSALTGCP